MCIRDRYKLDGRNRSGYNLRLMTFKFIPLLSLAALTLSLCQCAAPAGNDGSASAPAGSSSSDGTIKPGMTKAQVVEAWGEPDEKKSTASGETWRWAQPVSYTHLHSFTIRNTLILSGSTSQNAQSI